MLKLTKSTHTVIALIVISNGKENHVYVKFQVAAIIVEFNLHIIYRIYANKNGTSNLAVEIQFLEFPLIQLSGSSTLIIFWDSNDTRKCTYPNNPSSKYTFTKYTIHSQSDSVQMQCVAYGQLMPISWSQTSSLEIQPSWLMMPISIPNLLICLCTE